MKELPVGTKIKLPFATLKVEAVERSIFIFCNNCFFRSL